MDFNFTYYEKGGFKSEMTRVEAGRILGVGPSADPKRIQVAMCTLLRTAHVLMGTFVRVCGRICMTRWRTVR